MIRGTTPTLTLKVPKRDLRECNVIVTFQNKGITINKKNEDMEIRYDNCASYLDVPFSQNDTLAFPQGTANVQVNWIYQNGIREATQTAVIDIEANLYNKVMEYEV